MLTPNLSSLLCMQKVNCFHVVGREQPLLLGRKNHLETPP